MEAAANGATEFIDYAAVLAGTVAATFSIDVKNSGDANELAVKSWNSLWLFPLLSLACNTPCRSIYSVTDETNPVYNAAHREVFVGLNVEPSMASISQLEWAKENSDTFYNLIDDPVFATAMRCYGNSHVLHDTDLRIMLLWSGIEGILSVEAELSRRLALYACLLFDGSQTEKENYYKVVKKAYGIRSKVVHGGRTNNKLLEEGYSKASQILCLLLKRCVELGRVPQAKELDALAVSATVR